MKNLEKKKGPTGKRGVVGFPMMKEDSTGADRTEGQPSPVAAGKTILGGNLEKKTALYKKKITGNKRL